MILVFDVGNTETVLGLFQDERLVEQWRISTETRRTVDETGLLVRSLVRESGYDLDDLEAGIVASVVPVITPVLLQMCERHLAVATHEIRGDSGLPVHLDVEEPLSVGADRIVNTLAAMELYHRDTIAVDLGTATTFDCITGDGHFLGGVIAPGVRTGAETLVRRTARLPHVHLERPAHVIGRRTDTALHSGIFFGAVAVIDGIVRRMRDEWGRPDAFVVATGGLAPLLGPHCETIEKIEPHLTLHGLAVAYRYLK